MYMQPIICHRFDTNIIDVYNTSIRDITNRSLSMKEGSRTKYTVLGMLTFGNMTGYEIIKTIQESTNNFWSESEGQIYPALALCVKEGWATCKEDKSKDAHRIKKIYSITAKGKKELSTWLKKDSQPALVRNELLLKLFFGRSVEPKENIKHILHHQKEIDIELMGYKKIREQLSNQHKNSPHLKYWLITLDYGIRTAKAELAWCKETLKTLESE